MRLAACSQRHVRPPVAKNCTRIRPGPAQDVALTGKRTFVHVALPAADCLQLRRRPPGHRTANWDGFERASSLWQQGHRRRWIASRLRARALALNERGLAQGGDDARVHIQVACALVRGPSALSSLSSSAAKRKPPPDWREKVEAACRGCASQLASDRLHRLDSFRSTRLAQHHGHDD